MKGSRGRKEGRVKKQGTNEVEMVRRGRGGRRERKEE